MEIWPVHLEDRAWKRQPLRRRDGGDRPSSIPSPARRPPPWTRSRSTPLSHYVTPRPTLHQAILGIKAELKETAGLDRSRTASCLEAQRLEQRTRFDLEMLEATGSLQRDRELLALADRPRARRAAAPPSSNTSPTTPCVFADESHVTIGQIGGMYPRRLSQEVRRWPNTASACRPAWTTAPSNSRNGTPCGPRSVHVSRHPRPVGDWSKPAASSPNRSSAPPA